MRINYQLASPVLLNTPASRIIVAAATLLATAIGATMPAAAHGQDTGTLDSAAAAKAFPAKPPYSPYAGRNYPTRPSVRGHPSPHLVLDGRRCVRCPAHSA